MNHQSPCSEGKKYFKMLPAENFTKHTAFNVLLFYFIEIIPFATQIQHFQLFIGNEVNCQIVASLLESGGKWSTLNGKNWLLQFFSI